MAHGTPRVLDRYPPRPDPLERAIDRQPPCRSHIDGRCFPWTHEHADQTQWQIARRNIPFISCLIQRNLDFPVLILNQSTTGEKTHHPPVFHIAHSAGQASALSIRRQSSPSIRSKPARAKTHRRECRLAVDASCQLRHILRTAFTLLPLQHALFRRFGLSDRAQPPIRP